MKKSILKSFVFLTFISISIFSCKKDDPEPTPAAPTGGGTTAATGSFVWQEDGGASITADSAYWVTGSWGTGIRAYKSGMTNYFEINWDTINNTSIGIKVMVPPYGFTFIKGSDTYTCATNQNLTITGNSSSTLSGNFTVPVSGGTLTSISATFTNLPYRP